jgi:hypothetical protein
MRSSQLSIGSAFALGGLALVGSCATAPDQITHSPKAQKELNEALAGRVPGKPMDCLPNYRSTQMQIIDESTILFKDGRTVYVQNPRGGCPGLGPGGYTLVTREFSNNQMCQGDINKMVDLNARVSGGACVFGPFIPYTSR